MQPSCVCCCDLGFWITQLLMRGRSEDDERKKSNQTSHFDAKLQTHAFTFEDQRRGSTRSSLMWSIIHDVSSPIKPEPLHKLINL